MKYARPFLLAGILLPWLCTPAVAQGDPSGAFFSAYQEFQRAERFEREGRNADAIAKFRFVATQLGQLKSQNPDWQPLVVEFRLRKTQEAIVRLEGSLESPTLGPPPDLVTSTDEDVLPPVQPPKREGGKVAPTISISPGTGADEPAPATRKEKPAQESGADLEKLRQQLAAEKQRSAELEGQLKRGEAEMTSVSMELEKTKVAVVDLNTQLRHMKEASPPPPAAPAVSEEELKRLTGVAKELEETVAAAGAEKDQLAARMTESERQIADLTAQLAAAQTEAASAKGETDAAKAETEAARTGLAAAQAESEASKAEAAGAKAEAEAAKARTGELEAERETLVAERDGARKEVETVRGEMQTLTARVTALEDERTQLVAARDAAQKEAAEAKTALEKNAEIIEANRLLEEKLSEAAGKIAGMETDAAAKAQVVSGLQADLDKVRLELADAQTKLKDDRERFDKLQAVNDQLLKEYDEVTGALAAVKLGDVTAVEAKLLQQENEVLRGIIMRQIKEQARREQAYRLAQEEMERLEIRSDTLNDKINELAKPTLELSEAEQEMLKRPVVTLLDSDTSRMSAQIEVLKPKVEDIGGTGETEAKPAASPAPATAQGETPETGEAATAPAAQPEAGPSPEMKALLSKARDAFVSGNFSAAEKLYQKIVEQQPDNVVALANLGVSQFRQGKLTAAQLALEKALKVNQSDAFSLTTLGAVMIEQNRSEDAVAYLERANQSVSDDPITLNYLGVASSQLGQFGKAEQSLRRAITVKPDYAEAHFNLAVIYATAKPPSIALAKRHYEKALELGAGPDKRLAAMLQDGPGT